jgi:hypothetical protein
MFGRRRVVGMLVAGAFLVSTAAALAASSVGFSGKPGTNAPPPKLHGFKMKAFAPDIRTDFSKVKFVKGPTGKVHFSDPLEKRTANSSWTQWSDTNNPYFGAVYHETGTSVTLTLPKRTKAFYLYAEPFSTTGSKPITVKANGGASSGPVTVVGAYGATYFGFFAKAKSASVTKVTVHAPASADGIGIGEFGIH